MAGLATNNHDDVRSAFSVDVRRSFEQDPRFGISVLTEIASRALSPAVNDPGTAIDVIGRGIRILSLWEQPHDQKPDSKIDCSRVYVRGLTNALANRLHVSGPLAMIVAGVMIGNRGRAHAMSDTTRRYVDMFWELVGEILNAVLFVLVGMEVTLIALPGNLLLAGAIAAAVALLARLLTGGLPVAILGRAVRLPSGSWRVLTWGGLRGGISVALALSIPSGPNRDVVLALTYFVVVSSILGQGLTIARVTRWAIKHE
ncbi:DUF2254 family protein [Paraburkholderia fungorum]|uniref:DUF2254 family protein n=1 Tax=Paraburkholderia fungorum TaxID=134537 RepID=UPI0038B7F2FC